MLKKLLFCTFFVSLVLLSIDLRSQIISITGIEPQTFLCPVVPKDTLNKIFIHGRVSRQGDPKTYLSKANVQLKNTDLSVSTDSLGYYWLDISELSDATSKYILQCSFVNHQLAEQIIDHKIERTRVINFELMLNGGISTENVIIRDCFKGAGTEEASELKHKKKRRKRK